jgi:hypothetical protein
MVAAWVATLNGQPVHRRERWRINRVTLSMPIVVRSLGRTVGDRAHPLTSKCHRRLPGRKKQQPQPKRPDERPHAPVSIHLTSTAGVAAET